jgi:PKD repeat protein
VYPAGNLPYQAYSFTNSTSQSICVDVSVSSGCGSPDYICSVAYLGSFNPASVCANYLADIGYIFYGGSLSYSFNVPANTNFTVVVNGYPAGDYCNNFTVTVTGLPCLTDGGGACGGGVSANFSGTPTSGTAPLPVTFTDTSSGTISNRFWNFGDSSTTNITTNVVVHTYAAGSYTVSLVVAGSGGVSTNTKPNYINVLTPFQAWQVQYFGSTNNPNAASGVDADGTGQNNLFKYVAGLDPTNPASVFILQIATITNQLTHDNLLFHPLASGRTYTPQFNTDLVNGAWMPLAAFSGPVTNGNQATITDTNATQPNKFYRLDISLP